MQRTAWLWITTRKMTETCRRRTKVAIFMTHSLLLACPSSAFLGMAVGSSRAPTSISRAGAHYITWPRRGSLPTALTMQQDAGNLEQDSTPLVDALAEASANVRSPLFYPGHKMGRYDYRGCCNVAEPTAASLYSETAAQTQEYYSVGLWQLAHLNLNDD